MPNLYVIAGPNGAGKTTTAQKFLPDELHIVEFVNADNIAKGLSPFNPEGVAFEAGRIMLKRIKDLALQKIDFAFETTLSTVSYVNFLRTCKNEGYDIILIFVWLSSPKLAIERVAFRVSMGGHSIPIEIIERRYYKGLHNLQKYFLPLSTDWIIVDNSQQEIELIAKSTNGKLLAFNKEKLKCILNDKTRKT